MPWCPECRTEYVAGVKNCSDCGSSLVESLETEEHKDRKLVEYDTEAFLITAKDEMEANIIKAKLEQYGIPVRKKFREAGEYLSIYMGMSPFCVDLMVPSKLLDTAREVIDASGTLDADELDFFSGYNSKDFDNNPTPTITKPAMESSGTYYESKRRLRTWIVILVFMQGMIWLAVSVIRKIIAVFQKLF